MRAAWLIVAALGLFIGATRALPASVPTQAATAEFAKKSGCLECHSVDKKVTGPAYKDVANRYRNDDKARSALIETVKNGVRAIGPGSPAACRCHPSRRDFPTPKSHASSTGY